MKLLHTLRALFGATDPTDVTQEVRFECTPDTRGLDIHLPSEQYQKLRQGHGTPLQKAQLTLLNMLREQERAKPIANGFWVNAADAAGLDDDEAEVLGLPPRLDGRFLTLVEGRTGQSSFRVTITLQTVESEVPIQRHGPFLIVGLKRYRLRPAELLGLEAWDRHRTLPDNDKGEGANLQLMAMLQTAARSGMAIDLHHFERLHIITTNDVGVVATRMPDGSLELCPTLGDGSTPDQLQKRWHQLQVNENGSVLRVDNRILLLDKDRMAGIRNVFANRRIPADKVRDFINTPTAFLDAALVNLEVGFSVRVAGIGRIEHIDFGGLEDRKIDWFTLQDTLAPSDILKRLIQSPEDMARFEEKLAAAQRGGAQVIQFDGQRIDISDTAHLRNVLDSIHTQLHEHSSTAEEPPSPDSDDETPNEQLTVLLKDADQIHTELLQAAGKACALTSPDWQQLARAPYPHQQEGIEWMLKLLAAAQDGDPADLYRLQGALLADDMGLGKTYMTLVTAGCYIKWQEAQGQPAKPILVVAPLSLLENWEEEVSKTFKATPFRDVVLLQGGRDLDHFKIQGLHQETRQRPSLLNSHDLEAQEQGIRYALHVGPEAGTARLDMDRRLVLATYQTLRDYQFSLCKIDWGIVILDEAQNIKNPNALQTRAAKALKADFKLLSTGTPVENSLGDFWCLMDTAQPGLLGAWPHFRDRWVKPIRNADDNERDAVRTRIGQALRSNVGCFMLRRIKEDQLKGLPQKHIHSGVDAGQQHHGWSTDLSVTMSGAQLQAYEQAISGYRQQVASSDDKRSGALQTLARLRAISLHPRLGSPDTHLLPRDAEHARTLMKESGKLQAVLSRLDQIRQRGEKVILFMITKQLQRLMKQWLDLLYNLDIAIINGDTKAVATKAEDMTRKRLIQAFEATSGFNILIMSPIAAGVGLTVVGANHVIHVERHWNPAKEAQATDRVYRIGQTRDVHIHLPILLHPQHDSFDVNLDRLLRNKIILKDAVVTTESVSEQEIAKTLGLL